MDPLLLSGYIITIVIVIVVVCVIVIAWNVFLPRRMLYFIIAAFSFLIAALSILLFAELLAPYNSFFYLDPFLYTLYFGLLGFFFSFLFLLIIEIFYNNLSILYRLVLFYMIILTILLITSETTLIFHSYSKYPLFCYLLFEFTLLICIIAYGI
ncbi:MAG: hypothetical protein GF383_03785, partial [Candidatus Lokiarchaeota archaeon]|nr:hypothetical protein [Candidatus Lokiarchaeota archaeon]